MEAEAPRRLPLAKASEELMEHLQYLEAFQLLAVAVVVRAHPIQCVTAFLAVQVAADLNMVVREMAAQELQIKDLRAVLE